MKKVYRVFTRPDASDPERSLGLFESGTLAGAMKRAHEASDIPMEELRAEEVLHVCATCGQVLPAEKKQ